MSLTSKQYLFLCASVMLFFLAGGLFHQLGVPGLLLRVSMGKIQMPQAQYGSGMGPYPLMIHPPLNDTYSAPTMKRIAVVMSVHANAPLYRASFESHQRYCQLHGYRFMTQTKNMLPEEPFSHPRGHEYQKMAVLMQALMIGLDTNKFDWILWTDLDTYVIDPSIPLESFLPPTPSWPKDPEPYFLGNRDFNGFKAGVIFIKVVPWSVQLVSMVIADPYFLYNDGALDDSQEHKPATNDQASLSRIFQAHPLFGKHFQEIPASWMNTYPPTELDGQLNTTIPHLLPEKAEEWVKAMDEYAATRQLESRKRQPRRIPVNELAQASPPLDNDTLEEIKHVRNLQSTFMPSEFKDILQIHLVEGRKWSFDYLSLVSINAQMMQVATGALVYHYHENLPAGVDPAVQWEEEKRQSTVGLKHIQNSGLFEQRDKWYQKTRVGVKGMTWLDGR